MIIVAIDGPSGAGKSTVALRVAEALGLKVVDTGAIYRTVALAAVRAGIEPEQGAALAQLAAGLHLEMDRRDGATVVWLDGEDVSRAIRSQEASMAASRYSAVPEVRAALLELQRSLARREPGAVLEGRDIGTVVLPDADFKFFLTATAEERARRRHQELQARGEPSDYEELLRQTRARDAADEGRAVAPLRQADDALLVDADALTVDQVVATIARRVAGS